MADVNQFRPKEIHNFQELLPKLGLNVENPDDVSTAIQLLYGSVGSNVDVRDWDKILSSSDPLRSAQEATVQMIRTIASGNLEPARGRTGDGAEALRGAAPVPGGNLVTLGGDIVMTDAAGRPFASITPATAALYGVTQEQINSALETSGLASNPLQQEYVRRFENVGYQPYEADNLLVDYSSLLGASPPAAGDATAGANAVSPEFVLPSLASPPPAPAPASPEFVLPSLASPPPAPAPASPGSIPSFITPVGGGAAYRPVDLPGYDPTITGMRPAPNVGITPSGATAYSPYGAIAPYQFPELAPYQFPELAPNFFGINNPAYLEFLFNGTPPVAPQMAPQMAASPMQQGIMSLPPPGLMG
jgi:hypothetical protein